MNSERQRIPQTGVAANASSHEEPGIALPADLVEDRLAHVVAEIRAEAQVAPAAYLADAIVPKGGE